MNPLTNVKNITKLNEREIQLGISGQKSSWHNQYKDSAWLFIGGLPFDLTEGDVICVFSQYGEIVNINLVRDKKTGKSKGFCFLCYENQQSTVLAVDNFNAIKILGRTIRVDHVANYKPPKEYEEDEEELKALRNQGCAPTIPTEKPSDNRDSLTPPKPKTDKKKKKDKKKSKSKKHSKPASSEMSDSDESLEQRVKKKKHKSNREENKQTGNVKVKTEKYDPGYEKYANRESSSRHSPSSDSGEERKFNRKSSVKELSKRDRESRQPHRDSPVRDRESRHKHNPDSFLRDRSPISDRDARQNRDSSIRDRDSRRKYDSSVRETSPSRESRRAKYKQDSPGLDRSSSKRYDPRKNI